MRTLTLYGMVERILGRRLVWRLGRWLYTGSRRELQNDPLVNGEYQLQSWLLAGARNDKPLLFIDVGANIGNWTGVLLAKLKTSFSGRYRIHVFEPAPAQYAALVGRLGPQIADGTVVADRRGLAAHSGRASFHVTGTLSGTNALEAPSVSIPKPGSIEVEIATLDQVCAEQGYGHIDLVKVDTEGNDFNVISGARRLLDEQAIGILQFEYNWRWIAFGHSLFEVFEFLNGRPYVLGRLSQAGVEVYGTWHPELDRYIETNYVLVHRDRLDAIPHVMAFFDGSNVPRLTN